jgi:hypothetical protein
MKKPTRHRNRSSGSLAGAGGSSVNDYNLTRRTFLSTTSALAVAALVRPAFAAGMTERRKVDVCVYGGTSGGVIAAVALAKMGRAVLLIEPTRHLGGLTSGGLGLVDFGVASTIGGLTQQYFAAVREHYSKQGIDTDGWHLEPHVAELIFDQWIAEHHVEVVREARLASIKKDGRRIRSVTLDKAPPDHRGAPAAVALEREFLDVDAAMFIDCSYEGDLLGLAGVTHRTDREGREEFGESLAGVRLSSGSSGELRIGPVDPYVRRGDAGSGLLPLISAGSFGEEGAPSPITQPFNFRLCLTRSEPIAIAPPADYRAERYELVRRFFAAYAAIGEPVWEGDLYWKFGHENRYGHPRIFKIVKLLNGKTDMNNGGLLSTDYIPGDAPRYAHATWAERARIWHAHEDYVRGLFTFLRTDERLPEFLRRELTPWGLPRDEFLDTGGWPNQLYIREARRMVGSFVIDQHECMHPRRAGESIGFASYALDSHTCRRLVKGGVIVSEGGFNQRVKKPYPLPYSIIVPREQECENLLVPFCVSSTHVAFSSVRMEPPFMIMSESAAFAADQALRENRSVQRINIGQLRQRLRDAGQVVPAAICG